jgi:hypothetical protein
LDKEKEKMDLLITALTILLLVLIISIIAIKILKKNMKEAKKEISEQKVAKRNEIKNPKDSLLNLNKVSKEFFKKYLNTKSELTYSELSKILKKKKENDMADFCDKLDFLLYSGKVIKKEQVLELINSFLEVTRKAKEKEDKKQSSS